MLINLLQRVRLTYMLIVFFYLYTILALIVPAFELNRALLTLFSANSFLYGFYISPIVKDQNARVMDLNRQIHNEATQLYAAALKLRKLPKNSRDKILDLFDDYIKAAVDFRNREAEERAHEAIVSHLVDYKGKYASEITAVTDDIVENQENRTARHILLSNNKVYANEWVIMALLFSTTIFFILIIDDQDLLVMPFVKALICTGLTMLVIILLKMSTLTHKRAQNLRQPLMKLKASRYHRID